MKLIAVLTLFACPLAFAHEGHDHEKGEKKDKKEHADHDHDHEGHDHEHGGGEEGPNGGQIVESKAGFSFEVSVDEDRIARIVFLDKEHKAVELAEQSITGQAGERSAPVRLTFAKGEGDDANVLISDKALPEGAHVQMILSVKTDAEAKVVVERFELHLH